MRPVRTLVLTTITAITFFNYSLGQRYDFVIYNRYDVMVDVAITHKRGNRIEIKNVNGIPPKGGRKTFSAKIKENDYVEFNAISQDGSTYRAVRRTYRDMTQDIDNLTSGISPSNINLVRISDEPQQAEINFGELLLDITNNKYLSKLTDTSNVRINEKIGLASFLIFKGNTLLESFPATNAWRNESENKEYNGYSGFQVKRVVKNDSVGGDINAPLIGKLRGSFGNNRMVDYRWYVKNYRELVWVPAEKGPQTIFRDFPNDTGYNYLKRLVQTETDVEKYKIFFVSSLALTDSIKLSADNFTSIDKNLDMNFGLPASNIKVVKVGAKGEFYKSSRFYSEEDKGNIYNFFEVSPITQSALLAIYDDLKNEQLISQQEQFNRQQENFKARISDNQEDIVRTYGLFNTILPDKVVPITDFTAILSSGVPRLDALQIPDSLQDVQKIQELINMNSKISAFNSLRNTFDSQRSEYVSLASNYQQFQVSKMQEEKALSEPVINIIFASTIRKLSFDEITGINKYSERNNQKD